MSAPTEESSPLPARWSSSSEYPDMWVDPKDDRRYSDAAGLDERETLLEYLRAYRITLEMKCEGLDPAQLARRSVPPSPMSLLGLIRHMAGVEQYWFRLTMDGQDAPRRYPRALDADEWASPHPGPEMVTEAFSAWRDEIDFANQFIASHPDLSASGERPGGGTVRLREVLVHMIEEYARHCGHADLLRERIDGRVGQ